MVSRKLIVLIANSVLFLAGTSSAALTVSEKVGKQIKIYEKARDIFVDAGRKEELINRDDWEKLLSLPANEAFNQDDLKRLQTAHGKMIEQSRRKALKESRLSLTPLRDDDKKLKSFCAAFPKGALLHVHPSGTRDENTVKSMLETVNPAVDYKELLSLLKNNFYPGELDFLKTYTEATPYLNLADADQAKVRELFFLPEGIHPFARFEGLFMVDSLIKKPTPDFDYNVVTYRDFLKRAAAENVQYVEFTKDYPLDDKYLPLIEGWERDFEKETGVAFGFNYSFPRVKAGLNREQLQKRNAQLAEKLLTYRASPALLGIDLLDDETNAPALEDGQAAYGPVVAAVKDGKSRLHRTMHAGEMGDPRDPRDAIIMGAERLGHGVKLASDPVTLEWARRLALPIEVNLTSNLRLGVVDQLSHHPFVKYLRLGLKPSLSTDDEGLLKTDIDNECRLAVLNSDVTYAELKQMSFNSVETSFAPVEVKQRLLSELKSRFDSFEKAWIPKH